MTTKKLYYSTTKIGPKYTKITRQNHKELVAFISDFIPDFHINVVWIIYVCSVQNNVSLQKSDGPCVPT